MDEPKLGEDMMRKGYDAGTEEAKFESTLDDKRDTIEWRD